MSCAGCVDLRPLESDASSARLDDVRRVVLDVLDEAITLARAILVEHDRPTAAAFPSDADDGGEQSRQFFLSIDLLVAAEAPSVIADVSFMAVTELVHKRDRLAALGPGVDAWEVVAECGSALRRIRKAFTAMEKVIAEANGTAPKLDYTSEVRTALEIRKCYVGVRRSMRGVAPRDEASLRARLRGVGTQFAMLIGKSIYPDLRIADRVAMRGLQKRILDWLAAPSDVREGTRLWQDLCGYGDMIAQVRRRQELVEHDARMLVELAAARATGAPMAPYLVARTAALVGIDDELDVLLLSAEPDEAEWRPVLERICAGVRVGDLGA